MGEEQFGLYTLQYLSELVKELKPCVPVILYCSIRKVYELILVQRLDIKEKNEMLFYYQSALKQSLKDPPRWHSLYKETNNSIFKKYTRI